MFLLYFCSGLKGDFLAGEALLEQLLYGEPSVMLPARSGCLAQPCQHSPTTAFSSSIAVELVGRKWEELETAGHKVLALTAPPVSELQRHQNRDKAMGKHKHCSSKAGFMRNGFPVGSRKWRRSPTLTQKHVAEGHFYQQRRWEGAEQKPLSELTGYGRKVSFGAKGAHLCFHLPSIHGSSFLLLAHGSYPSADVPWQETLITFSS